MNIFLRAEAHLESAGRVADLYIHYFIKKDSVAFRYDLKSPMGSCLRLPIKVRGSGHNQSTSTSNAVQSREISPAGAYRLMSRDAQSCLPVIFASSSKNHRMAPSLALAFRRVESTTLALPHRRLVCFCRVSEVIDPLKKQSHNVHQREVFLFNDTLLMTKLFARRKSTSTYTFRESHCLVGAQVCPFKNQCMNYSYGVEINFTLENKRLHFNAKSDDDRTKLIEDLRESIFESCRRSRHATDEMEALRIELELRRQTGLARPVEHLLQDGTFKDSDLFLISQGRRNSDRNSASYDVDATQIHRHSSATSLDSGMSSASLGSRESFPHAHMAKITEQKASDDEKSQATEPNF
uniref:IQ motif and SEC7 domain-containing protein n=1 Tax=Romanomermis culicivorax TaxID=13658 RepID=A0A915IEJ9_ROMCU